MLTLDRTFGALADTTRRAVIARLTTESASVGELARPFDMALPSFLKHIHALEDSGWITTHKQGRVRTCQLRPEALGATQGWLLRQQRAWERRTDLLERFVTRTRDADQRTGASEA